MLALAPRQPRDYTRQREPALFLLLPLLSCRVSTAHPPARSKQSDLAERDAKIRRRDSFFAVNAIINERARARARACVRAWYTSIYLRVGITDRDVIATIALPLSLA